MTKQALFINLFLSTLLLGINSFGQTKIKKQRAEFDSKKIIQVKYGNSTWNNDPLQIDNGVVILKDRRSNKIMQVALEETAPDSSIFSGTYSINWGGDQSIMPEVYVLDEKHVISKNDLVQILADIESGKLKRKPLFYKKNEVGTQVLEVFATKKEAQEALNVLRMQMQKNSSLDVSSVTSKDYAAAKAVTDSKEMTKFALENELRKKEIQKRIIDRFRLAQTELHRIQKYQNDFNKLDDAAKKKRVREASQFAEAGLDFYKANQYESAEDNFRKACFLDPTNTKYYFQYGISLYKAEKYNAAIIVFDISKAQKEYEKESIYYAGLSQYGMKDYETAYETFKELKKTNDSKLSPLASFYLGLINYDQKLYERAKVEFQDVLDTSKDPKLDQKAENYLDNIIQVIQYAQTKQQKLFLMASLGALYDSNVLQQSDSNAGQGGATEEKSLRYILGLGAYYKPVFTKAYEFGVKATTDYIYTENEDATDYDPWSIQLVAPFAYKTALFGKSFKLDIKPGYELLYLGQEADSGKPKKTLKGYYLDVGNTFIMKDDWYTTFTLGFRKDDFFESSDQGQNTNKLSFKWTNMLFTNKVNTKGILADVIYTTSDATEATYSYNRYDLSALYLTPIFKDKYTFAGGIAMYLLDYETKETQFNKTLNLTLSKPINDWLSGTILGTYVINSSSDSSAEYDKWTLGFLFSAGYAF